MQYINPYKLLNIPADDLPSVDSNTVSKAKKKLLAEIELSESNAIVHSKIELNKGDCIKAIDDLDNNNKREFHLFIIKNKPLFNFLTSRDLTFFTQFKFESIYKDNEFLDFISPFFSEQYDQALFINYKKNISHNLKAILAVKPITNFEYSDKCYKSTYSFLREIYFELEKINKDIENNNSVFIKENFQGLARLISDKINVAQLNALPYYFQTIRNQIAHSIRDIEVKLYNDPYNNYSIAFQLIEFAKSINTDGLTLQTITKSFYTVKKQYESCQTSYLDSTKSTTPKQEVEETTEIKDKKNIDSKKKLKDHIWSIGILSVFVIGFFYRPLQYIILSVELIILFAVLKVSFKKKDESNFSIAIFLRNSSFLIIGSIFGFFYPIPARIIIAYYFFLFTRDVISGLLPRKQYRYLHSQWMMYLFIFLSLTVNGIFYFSNSAYKFTKEDAKIHSEQPKEIQTNEQLNPTEQTPLNVSSENNTIPVPSTGEINFENSNQNRKATNDHLNLDKSKTNKPNQPNNLKNEPPKQKQKTGEIKF